MQVNQGARIASHLSKLQQLLSGMMCPWDLIKKEKRCVKFSHKQLNFSQFWLIVCLQDFKLPYGLLDSWQARRFHWHLPDCLTMNRSGKKFKERKEKTRTYKKKKARKKESKENTVQRKERKNLRRQRNHKRKEINV